MNELLRYTFSLLISTIYKRLLILFKPDDKNALFSFVAVTCSIPTISDGTIVCSGSEATEGENCNVVCNTDYTPSDATVTCGADTDSDGDGEFDKIPTCTGNTYTEIHVLVLKLSTHI